MSSLNFTKEAFFIASQAAFAFAICFYAITCFQWFSYRVERVLFHFTRPLWHATFFAIPLALFYATGAWFWIYFYFAFLPALFFLEKKIDKNKIFNTNRKHFLSF